MGGSEDKPEIGIFGIDMRFIEVAIFQFFVLGVILTLIGQRLTLGENDFTTLSEIFTLIGSPILGLAIGLTSKFNHNYPL